MITPPLSPAPRLGGLDGLRALAVSLVVIYHLFPGWWLRGGFVGVDVFFVISGFLITTLLLREHATTGRIRLGAFWQRRARRLLPALVAVVAVCASAAWLIGGDVLVRLGEQVFGAATFSYNWVSIAGGDGYFAADTPELFRNLWSLAVEEQFYVLWPLVLPLFLLLPRAWARTAAALALAAASAAWMATVIGGSDGLTRAYFGTDTHAFGILLGVALAFTLERALHRPPAWTTGTPWRVATAIAGAAAVIGLVVVSLPAPAPTAAVFPGTIALASVLSAVAIVAGVFPGSWFARTIDIAPLRWIGDRSYGLYLWHWPLLVLVVAAAGSGPPDAGVPVASGCLALALTVVIAEASYRFVELPVRRHGFRGSLHRVGRRLAGTPLARLRALTALAAIVVVAGGTSAAIVAAPSVSSAQASVEAGIAALAAQPSPSSAPAVTASPHAPAPQTPALPGAPGGGIPSPTPTPVTGDQITAVGDSVMLAAAPALLERLPGISVDAAVSRSMWAGPGIIEAQAAAGTLRPFVVVALGTNGPIERSSLEAIARTIGPDRQLALVNAFAPRSWTEGVNAELTAFAAARPGTIVADWSRAIAARTDLLADDDIHPGDEGGRLFADVVQQTVTALEQDRTERVFAAARLRSDVNRWIRRFDTGITLPVPPTRADDAADVSRFVK